MGVTEFYGARTDTKMTLAAERLAVIAAITLPITSLSSVMGMNVIANDSTRWISLTTLLLIMLARSLTLLRWAPRTGVVVIIRVVGSAKRDDQAGDDGPAEQVDQVVLLSSEMQVDGATSRGQNRPSRRADWKHYPRSRARSGCGIPQPARRSHISLIIQYRATRRPAARDWFAQTGCRSSLHCVIKICGRAAACCRGSHVPR